MRYVLCEQLLPRPGGWKSGPPPSIPDPRFSASQGLRAASAGVQPGAPSRAVRRGWGWGGSRTPKSGNLSDRKALRELPS